MKDVLKALGMLALVLGMLYGALLLLRHFAKRNYITVEED